MLNVTFSGLEATIGHMLKFRGIGEITLNYIKEMDMQAMKTQIYVCDLLGELLLLVCLHLSTYTYDLACYFWHDGLLMQLVVSWHMKAATMCEFSKQEFIDGLETLG